ncbi:MAG: hypothetical protein JWO69_464 [Thermoleophilia bacterium]|jgi:hypothetical protein|nr:hypothetical protein [Thermoleophilia bacterium]
MTDSVHMTVTDLVWDAWTSLGVAGWRGGTIETVIDLEALVVTTLALGDQRLVHESIDWAIRHARFVLPGRIRRMAPEAGAETGAETWLATVAHHSRSVSWKHDVAPLEGFEPSGKSVAVGATPGMGGEAVRLRSLHGAAIRSEIVRAFHPVVLGMESGLSSSEIAWLAGATKVQVNTLLAELVQAGFVSFAGSEKRRTYFPEVGRPGSAAARWWELWRGLGYGPWRLAPAVLPHIDWVLRQEPKGRAGESIDHVMRYQAIMPSIVRIDPELAVPMKTGSGHEVISFIRAWAEEALPSLHAAFRGGRQPIDAGVRERSHPGMALPTQNPWDAWGGRMRRPGLPRA